MTTSTNSRAVGYAVSEKTEAQVQSDTHAMSAEDLKSSGCWTDMTARRAG